jgi:outer membrane lipoprotein carrier protein
MPSFTSLAARVVAFTALGLATLWLAAGTARADGLTDLETFLRQTQQGRASFTQVVTPPQKAGETRARAKTSSGEFEFQRPDRFRFEYTRPFEQTIVADGQTLWLYDVDLNQVSARRQQDVLGNTPAALLAAAADLKALGRVFELRSEAATDGTEWVQATPRQRDGQLQQVRIGFRQGQLAVLDILDSFGQRSVMTFGALNVQPGFKPDHFRFTPPPGAEVIRQ